jgi:hypothetical protein
MLLRHSFFRTRSSSRARVAIGVCAALAVTPMAVVAAGIAPPAGASGSHVGPVYPAPGSGTEITSGDSGVTGGATFSFSKVKTKKFKSMVWGLDPTFPPTWSFGLDTPTLLFDATDSNLPSGEAVYSGAAEFPNLNGSTPSLPVRLVVQAGGGLAMETSKKAHLGVNSSVGGVIPITTKTWSVNLTFEVSPDGGTTWDPADTYYNGTPHLVAGTGTSSNASGAFWYAP